MKENRKLREKGKRSLKRKSSNAKWTSSNRRLNPTMKKTYGHTSISSPRNRSALTTIVNFLAGTNAS